MTSSVPRELSAADLLKTQQFFNRPQRATPSDAPVDRYVFAAVAKLVPRAADPGGVAVDLGCNRGRYAALLAETYEQVIAVDCAAEAIKAAPPLANVEYRVLDVEKDLTTTPLGRGVDLFLAVGLFELLSRPDRLCAQLFAMTAPGGRVLVVLPNRRSVHHRLFRAEMWFARTVLRRPAVFIGDNGAGRDEVTVWLRTAGFTRCASGAIVGLPPSLLWVMPAALQVVLLRFASLARHFGGGSYHWILAERSRL
jgi:SAM-dependent methyltransferase